MYVFITAYVFVDASTHVNMYVTHVYPSPSVVECVSFCVNGPHSFSWPGSVRSRTSHLHGLGS